MGFQRVFLLLAAFGVASCTHTIDERAFYISEQMKTQDKGVMEGDTGLLFGEALQTPGNGSFTINVNGEKVVYRQRKEDFVPVTIDWSDWTASYGKVPTVLIARAPADPPRPLIVRCYGNGGTLYNNAALNALSALPYGDVLQFDYPGFDGDASLATLDNFEALAQTAAAELNARDDDRPLVLWGHSLGGLACAELATRLDHVDAVVMETTARTAREMGRSQVPWLVRPFVRLRLAPGFERYDIVQALEQVDAPVLVVGARKDKVLKVGPSRELAAELKAAGVDAEYLELANANHVSAEVQPEFAPAMEAFLARATAAD